MVLFTSIFFKSLMITPTFVYIDVVFITVLTFKHLHIYCMVIFTFALFVVFT